jgi:hypothetical protein
MATLEPHNGIGPTGQPIDYLAFALVTPLSSDYSNVGHAYTFPPAREILKVLRQDSTMGLD